MTFVLRAWFERHFLRLLPVERPALLDPVPPLAIEVERLPDYLWRDLGFPLPARPEQDR